MSDIDVTKKIMDDFETRKQALGCLIKNKLDHIQDEINELTAITKLENYKPEMLLNHGYLMLIDNVQQLRIISTKYGDLQGIRQIVKNALEDLEEEKMDYAQNMQEADY